MDVGCGNGALLKHVHDLRHCNPYGIEIRGRSAERASRIPEIKLKIGQLTAEDFPHGFFDVVTLFHVFEHLTQPADTLLTVSQILKPGGICVISFPNIGSFQARLFKGRWLHLDPPRHLIFFEPDDFVMAVSRLGLVPEKITFFSPEQNPFGMIQSILNGFSNRKNLLFEVLKGNRDYARGIPWPVLLAHEAFFALSFPLFVVSDFFESWLRRGATVQWILRKS